MDFGLAGLAHEIEDGAQRNSWPTWHLSSWLAKRVTARSDIYALGLVFYELPGKPAFEGNTQDEIYARSPREHAAPPSTLVRDLDPAVEIRKDHPALPWRRNPENRPSSALIVSAARCPVAVFDCYLPPRQLRPRSRNRSDAARSTCSMTKWWLSVQDFCGRSFLGQCGVAANPVRRHAARRRRGHTETKEHVVGFWVLETADRTNALAVGAQGCP